MTVLLEKPSPKTESVHLELLDYRRRVAELYGRLRSADSGLKARSDEFRQCRNELFRRHAQSALSDEQRRSFEGLSYYDYDPSWRFRCRVDTDLEPELIEIRLQDDGLIGMRRFGRIHFRAAGQPLSLSLFWIAGYGGGVFLPFRDATNGDTTYGGGRYLLDTIKHADLGQEDGSLIIDFNYAYNPSCAYNARWHCPLAPEENWLPVAVPAGEQHFTG